MRALLVSTLAFATTFAVALSSAAPRGAQAATGVARCAMPDGTHAYTDTGCRSLGGAHVILSTELLNRIRRERRHESRLTGEPLVEHGLLAGSVAVAARRPLAHGCATTPRQLALDLRASVVLGNVNRIAESFDWAGMSHNQAMQVMTRIEQLVGLAVVDAEYFGATMGMGAPEAGDSGTMQVILQDASMQKVADFDVRRDSGCYFLRHAWIA
ncbi:hypothetical protein [Marilutibacter alkalisoli]|uniref:DUF4124 domain-containing protein n=1 Tax=Marilutibacter alkalisoli TaxID=2591633 RepID=A0A514BPD7_9GAMM|nr:hypothetical protein [Lysobacter alkalisoli]QDH69250.1 hypothetical protein FKV23_03405 [Lysobacter alkalisoli]